MKQFRTYQQQQLPFAGSRPEPGTSSSTSSSGNWSRWMTGGTVHTVGGTLLWFVGLGLMWFVGLGLWGWVCIWSRLPKRVCLHPDMGLACLTSLTSDSYMFWSVKCYDSLSGGWQSAHVAAAFLPVPAQHGTTLWFVRQAEHVDVVCPSCVLWIGSIFLLGVTAIRYLLRAQVQHALQLPDVLMTSGALNCLTRWQALS